MFKYILILILVISLVSIVYFNLFNKVGKTCVVDIHSQFPQNAYVGNEKILMFRSDYQEDINNKIYCLNKVNQTGNTTCTIKDKTYNFGEYLKNINFQGSQIKMLTYQNELGYISYDNKLIRVYVNNNDVIMMYGFYGDSYEQIEFENTIF